MDDVGDVASNVDAENAGSNADNTATTEESSQDSLMMIPETTEDHDEVSSDDEVDGDLVVAHDDFAIRFIKKTKVHFRLRRTTPTLWRHEAICFVAMRVFTAIDDSKHIATAGVNWQIDGKICTVLVVACLGYAPDPGRTAKVADTRATEIIVRESKYGTSAIKFSQMRKVSSLARFHKHTHTYIPDTHTHTHITNADHGGQIIQRRFTNANNRHCQNKQGRGDGRQLHTTHREQRKKINCMAQYS